MRNYFKIYGLAWRLHSQDHMENGDLYTFGATLEELMENVRFYESIQQLNFPNPGHWTFTYPNAPAVIYFELNKTYFANVLNIDAQTIWGATHLPSILGWFPRNLFAQTRVESEGSPRNIFPTSSGTDGQRLRK
jgi:hypothetical protein